MVDVGPVVDALGQEIPRTGLGGFFAVIPAGGSGTRLWPLSRRSSPKFLHDLTGSGRSLLQDTVHRLQPLCGDRLVVVTGEAHAEAVRADIPELGRATLLVEPSPKDSLPAIGLAAAVLARRDPDAVLGSFAADHVVRDRDRFTSCVAQAVALARTDVLVTLGIRPTYPATGFGYLAPGPAYQRPPVGAPDARPVEAFVEKPPRDVAQRYLRAGHLWNAGIFVVRAGVLLDMIDRWQPAVAAGLRSIAADPTSIQDVWPGLPSLAIDRAIAEPAATAQQVAVIPADFGWDDVGDFASLAEQLPESARHPGLRVLGSEDMVHSTDSSGVVATRGGRVVVTLGVPDVVVIDTADVVLVTTRARVQDVKEIVEDLHRAGREDLT